MMMQRYLPSSKPDSDDLDSGRSVDPYAGNEFWMYEFKVRQCAMGLSHDWTECPYSHPGENARRRDPRKFHYSDAPCPDFWNGSCERGDSCEFAHGLYECWLHPARYRTQPCKDGTACDRRVCFFAHTPEQLRIFPQQAPQTPSHSPKSNVPPPVDSYDGSPSKKEKGDCFVPSLGDTCQTTRLPRLPAIPLPSPLSHESSSLEKCEHSFYPQMLDLQLQKCNKLESTISIFEDMPNWFNVSKEREETGVSHRLSCYRHEIKTTAAKESHLPGKGEKGKSILLEETAESSFEKGHCYVPYLRDTCLKARRPWESKENLLLLLRPLLPHVSPFFGNDRLFLFYRILEMQIQKCEEMGVWKHGSRRAKVFSDFDRVETMLNRLNPIIVREPLTKLFYENFKIEKSEAPRLFMYYDNHEIKMTAELLEKMLNEINDDGRFTEDWGYKALRRLSDFLLDFIEKQDSVLLERRAAESSGEKVDAQSKGVVSKTNALRKEEDSQRDDPEELFINLVEMETTLEECVFRLPQHASFIAAAGYKPILVV